MQLSDAINEVLDLQSQYSSDNTEAMRVRGNIIRRDIPQAIAALRPQLADAARIPERDLLIEGSDGVGRKSEVPWVRIASTTQSAHATEGWYVVWLFRRDGAGVYLALGHGSATFQAGALISRPLAELAERMGWARAALGAELKTQDRLTYTVELASRAKLPLMYERSCVGAFYYPRAAGVASSQMAEDMLALTAMLGNLYTADKLGRLPFSVSPDVHDAEEAAAKVARPQQAGRQGFRLSFEARRVVELHAVKLATHHLEGLGYNVMDVGAVASYDLHATKLGEELRIEVKGTTGQIGAILLTNNEVELHRTCYPHNGLIVVYNIDLNGENMTASGGDLRVHLPWSLDGERLQGLTYSYRM